MECDRIYRLVGKKQAETKAVIIKIQVGEKKVIGCKFPDKNDWKALIKNIM